MTKLDIYTFLLVFIDLKMISSSVCFDRFLPGQNDVVDVVLDFNLVFFWEQVIHSF